MPSGPAFLRFWWTDRTRNTFLSCLSKEELSQFRLACHDFSVRTAPVLFKEISIPFRASTFIKPVRMAALNRIGDHVQSVTFSLSHSDETFLPPLITSEGEEVTFHYKPYTQVTKDPSSRLSIPTYGSWEMTDILVKQYSPLFHAAANVPSFIRAFSAIPKLQHLKISCPGEDPSYRYRRSIVDYALISLRIAVERSPLVELKTLTLDPVHPSAVFYLNPIIGLGSTPKSQKRWKQIRKLSIGIDGIPPYSVSPPDHLKHLHSYLQVFKSTLHNFHFRWHGTKGPCPLSLRAETSIQVPSPGRACPRTCHRTPRSIRFPKLRIMEAENVVLDASQISAFITAHQHTLHQFNFEKTCLRSGTWDDALAPLTRISGNDKWKEKAEEVMDVPLLLSPVGLEESQIRNAMQGSPCPTTSRPPPLPVTGWHKAGAKGRDLLLGTPEHMRKFLRLSMFYWL